MGSENFKPVFGDLEELQVLFNAFDELAGAALDGSGSRKDSALWLISRCSELAARDIGLLVRERMAERRGMMQHSPT